MAIGVGVIGASAERGWAKDSHVPAVQATAGLELEAVVGSSQVKAETAKEEFGAKTAYGDALAMFANPAVQVVAVCVNVPDHRALVLGALSAGKDVYCEWPLGRNLAETREMAEAAAKAGLKTAIGLQTRANPIVAQARRMLDEGAIGRVLRVRVLSTTMAFGPTVEPAMKVAEDAANGVTLVTIQGAHTLDFVVAVMGCWRELQAQTAVQFAEVTLEGRRQARSTPDLLLVQGEIGEAGVPITIEVAGGCAPERTPFVMAITGERGELRVEGGAPRGFQSGRLRLLLDGKEQEIEDNARLPDAAVNVAGIYAGLLSEIEGGAGRVPDFGDAVRLQRMVDDVLRAAVSGERVQAESDWPVQQQLAAV